MSSLKLNEKLMKKPKVLYNNTTGSAGSITLGESPIDEKLILIEFTADGITSQTSFFYKPNVKFSLLLSYVDNSNTHLLYESTYTINDKNITFNQANNNFITTTNNVAYHNFNSYIRINKVLMY